ncbi:MAG TPA: tetratricopeptide repeat protein [Candidatus Krumholzibacteria bacterium]|nr:tetratricopeptide repeat protein [Candidatus Krumholzibacteria bacterium]
MVELARRLVLSALFLSIVVVGARAEDLAKAQSLAAQGNHAYEAGDYDGAIESYQAAIDAGLNHEVLFYNLGNAWFKKGSVGKAILYYRRALLRDPRNSAARENLKQAKALIKDEALAPLSIPLFLKPLVWLYSHFSLDEWTGAALGFWLLLALVGALRAWWRPSWLKGRGMIWALCCLFAVCSTMTLVHADNQLRHRAAIVTTTEVDVRSGPGENYNLSFKIHEGLRVFVDTQRPQWTRIHLGGDLIGWVPASSIEEI